MSPIDFENDPPIDGVWYQGLSPEEATQKYLSLHPDSKELVLTQKQFFWFMRELGSRLGTAYPYQDGGVRYPGPTHFVIVKGDYL